MGGTEVCILDGKNGFECFHCLMGKAKLGLKILPNIPFPFQLFP